jgi:hypothetical protein
MINWQLHFHNGDERKWLGYVNDEPVYWVHRGGTAVILTMSWEILVMTKWTASMLARYIINTARKAFLDQIVKRSVNTVSLVVSNM